jgi:hypothetical protein
MYHKYIKILSYTLKDIEIHYNTQDRYLNKFKYTQILWKTLKYTINTQDRHLNKFKYTQLLRNILKYIEMYYKYTELHWNTLLIQ